MHGLQCFLHSDSGYNARHYLDLPFVGAMLSAQQLAVNSSSGSLRVTVKWMYKEIKLYWFTMDFKNKLHTYENAIALIYLVAMILTNIRTCMYGNTVSQYF